MSEIPHVVPSFDSVDDLQIALAAKNNFEAVDLYPRDGTRQLSKVESRLAELARVEDGELLLCSSGMAAVVGAVEACMEPGDAVAIPFQGYSQTLQYGRHLADRGIKVVPFDSGSPESVSKMIAKHQPGVILSETVTNGPDMPVLDVEALLTAVDDCDVHSSVILDNTLPLSTGFDVTKYIDSDRPMLIVESATKGYTRNAEIAGLVYGKHAGLLDKVRQQRRTKGFGPNVAAIDRIDGLLPQDLTEFDKRNLRIFKASGRLAMIAFHALEADDELFVMHPLLPDHPNQALAECTLQEGGSPVFFIQCQRDQQFDLARRLWEHPVIKENAELGQSFGFDTARILPDANYPMVRISAGAETDTEQLGAALHEALSVDQKLGLRA